MVIFIVIHFYRFHAGKGKDCFPKTPAKLPSSKDLDVSGTPQVFVG